MHPIEEKIPLMPAQPGVYIMKGEAGTILYVGKAKNLKVRVRSYVAAGAESNPKVRFLVPKVEELDYIVTRTEKEALLLENTLIKKHRPRYNITLKDDKTYLQILLDRKHPFPRFVPVRRSEVGADLTFFGPYSSSAAMRDTLRQIHRLYPLRTCRDREFNGRKRPCLQFQMDRCSGSCTGNISQGAYLDMVDQAVLILQGRSEELVRLQEGKMLEAAEAMRYEEAACLRDRIRSIRLTIERQRVVVAQEADMDVIGDHQEGDQVEIALLQIRGGKLVERKGFSFLGVVAPFPELLRSFLMQYYSREEHSLPPEVLLPGEPEDTKALQEIMADIKGASCFLRIPRKGEKKKLVDLARLNARHFVDEQGREERFRISAMEEVQKRLRLAEPPECIQCFDISNLQGDLAVGSCVTFRQGLPCKKEYRRYRIRVERGIDDYGMMYEILSRRLKRGQEVGDLPDLLLVDGGKGHLGVALRALKDVGIKGVPSAAIAKGRQQSRESGEGHKDAAGDMDQGDRVFLPGRANPVGFPSYSNGLRLLQQVRDEAHRFAVAYHRGLRSRALDKSELDNISGIGPKRKKALLKDLGDINNIRKASEEELGRVKGMNEKAARSVWDHFHPEEG